MNPIKKRTTHVEVDITDVSVSNLGSTGLCKGCLLKDHIYITSCSTYMYIYIQVVNICIIHDLYYIQYICYVLYTIYMLYIYVYIQVVIYTIVHSHSACG